MVSKIKIKGDIIMVATAVGFLIEVSWTYNIILVSSDSIFVYIATLSLQCLGYHSLPYIVTEFIFLGTFKCAIQYNYSTHAVVHYIPKTYLFYT